MLAAERRSIILQKAQSEGKVVVSALSREFDVSEETIRRDLERLEEEGHVTKTYGGAVFNDTNSIDLPFNVRWNSNYTGKQKIAMLVNSIIEDGDHIFLDASTTAVMIAKYIKDKTRLTVITNSLENMLVLSELEDCTVISTGGILDAETMSFVGEKALGGIRSYNVEKVFLSCKGIDTERGITDGNDNTAGIKQNMIEAAKKVYLAVDSSKFDRIAFTRIMGFNRVDTVITDMRPDDKWIDFFDKSNIELIYPEAY